MTQSLNPSLNQQNRVLSIDIFRGLTILVMVFVNDVAGVKGLPWWTYHIPRGEQGITYGSQTGRGRIILEHTSANPNGPLHVGHIRNSVIGDALARILKRAGYEVETQYYINDMGRQIAIVSWALEHFDLNTGKKSDHAIADIYVYANRILKEQPDNVAQIDELMQLLGKRI